MEPGRKCTYAGSCHFAHGEHELIDRPSIPMGPSALTELMRFFPEGFAGLVHNCCDRESIEQTVDLVQWGRDVLGGRVFASFGVHPSDYYTYSDELEALLLDGFKRCGDRAIAWGECGLDYYRNPTSDDKIQMRSVFERQVRLAMERNLPLVVHSRDAETDTLEVLRTCLPHDARMHLHSFTGNVDTLAPFLEEWSGCFLGVNGLVTYPNMTSIHEMVRCTPLERILLETDGPYMMPEPYRYDGGGSHAGHIPWIAQRIAEIKGVSLEVVLIRTHANFSAMYGAVPQGILKLPGDDAD